jgi:hypothetical protein
MVLKIGQSTGIVLGKLMEVNFICNIEPGIRDVLSAPYIMITRGKQNLEFMDVVGSLSQLK